MLNIEVESCKMFDAGGLHNNQRRKLMHFLCKSVSNLVCACIRRRKSTEIRYTWIIVANYKLVINSAGRRAG